MIIDAYATDTTPSHEVRRRALEALANEGEPMSEVTYDALRKRVKELEAALKQARRDALEEAARRVEIMWLMFREKDNGASDWIFRAHDDIPTGDDFVAAIRALGEKE